MNERTAASPARGLSRLAPIGVLLGVVIAAVLFTFYMLARPGPGSNPQSSSSAGLSNDAATLAAISVGAPSSSAWLDLTPDERATLLPLEQEWSDLGSAGQHKWLAIADRFPKMNESEQKRTQERMREWAKLSPEQRRLARDTYLRARAMPPEKRAEMLQKYQQLPPEEKEHLALIAREHKSVLPVKPRPKDELLPNKAQIREGSKQRVPGFDLAKSNAAPTTVAPSTSSTALPTPAGAVPAVASGSTGQTPTAAAAPAAPGAGASSSALVNTPAPSTTNAALNTSAPTSPDAPNALPQH